MEDLSQKFKEVAENEKVEKIVGDIKGLVSELSVMTKSSKKKFEEIGPEDKKKILGGVIGFIMLFIGIIAIKKFIGKHHKDCCK